MSRESRYGMKTLRRYSVPLLLDSSAAMTTHTSRFISAKEQTVSRVVMQTSSGAVNSTAIMASEKLTKFTKAVQQLPVSISLLQWS